MSLLSAVNSSQKARCLHHRRSTRNNARVESHPTILLLESLKPPLTCHHSQHSTLPMPTGPQSLTGPLVLALPWEGIADTSTLRAGATPAFSALMNVTALHLVLLSIQKVPGTLICGGCFDCFHGNKKKKMSNGESCSTFVGNMCPLR